MLTQDAGFRIKLHHSGLSTWFGCGDRRPGWAIGRIRTLPLQAELCQVMIEVLVEHPVPFGDGEWSERRRVLAVERGLALSLHAIDERQ